MKELYDKCKVFFESLEDPIEYIGDYVRELHANPKLGELYSLVNERDRIERDMVRTDDWSERQSATPERRKFLIQRYDYLAHSLKEVNQEIKKMLLDKNISQLYNSYASDLNRFVDVYSWYIKYNEENSHHHRFIAEKKCGERAVPTVVFRNNLPVEFQQKYRDMEFSHNIWCSSKAGKAPNIKEIKEKILLEMEIEKSQFSFGKFLFPSRARQLQKESKW